MYPAAAPWHAPTPELAGLHAYARRELAAGREPVIIVVADTAAPWPAAVFAALAGAGVPAPPGPLRAPGNCVDLPRVMAALNALARSGEPVAAEVAALLAGDPRPGCVRVLKVSGGGLAVGQVSLAPAKAA